MELKKKTLYQYSNLKKNLLKIPTIVPLHFSFEESVYD